MCGGGERMKTRTKKLEAGYGGEECKGPANITENCNIQECPGKVFFFQMAVFSNILLNFEISVTND